MSSKIENKDLSEEEKLPPECYQEDALYYEYYPEQDEEGLYKTDEQMLQRLEELDNKGCCPWRLGEVYPYLEVTTREEFEKMEEERIEGLRQFKKEMKNKEYRKLEKKHMNDAQKQSEEDKDKAEK